MPRMAWEPPPGCIVNASMPEISQKYWFVL